ncbi:unnamed protein product [Adineta ricciae]|uniref:Nuclear hormone receptor HR96 n=1 Tax=Adineta ricciae TaxID=249248 RepID=A0A814PFZ5_ADIRI|nr:unnamed protein product [Adineta ricciae]
MDSTTSTSKKRRIMIITADESVIEQIQNNTNASFIKSIVLDGNGDNVEVSQSNIRTIQAEAQSLPAKKQKTGTLTCVVCSSPANGYNFDAITCESCKAFFRRNALKDSVELECRRGNNCDITIDSRRRCGACRLAKCLKSGMNRDRLLTAEQKAVKLRKIEENRNLTTLTHSEPRKDNQDEDVKPIITAVHSDAPSPKSTNLLLVKDVADLLPNEPPSEKQGLLSLKDLQRVETIQLSYEQRIELAAREGLPWNPTVHATTLLDHINSHSVTALRLLSFFKQIPEFNDLNVHDRVTLIKYNLMPLTILNCTLSYDVKTETIQEAKSDVPWDSSILLTVHGDQIYQRVKKIFESFSRIAKYDQRIIQLALITLILTKGFSANSNVSEPILNDGLAVYRAQSYYTELLWKYLETVHGYGKAIHIFNELVAHFMSWQALQNYLARNLPKMLTPAEMNDLLPIMKSLINIQ